MVLPFEEQRDGKAGKAGATVLLQPAVFWREGWCQAMRFAEEDRGAGFSDACLVVTLVGTSSKVAKVTEESWYGWCAEARGVFQRLAGCRGHGGLPVAPQGLPFCLRRSKCCRWAALAAGLPSLGDMICAASQEKGLFGKARTVFLAWKPFGRRFDLHFHFFFMLLEQRRANREADAINFEAQVSRCHLGKGRPGGGGEGQGVWGVIKNASSSSNVRASLPARHSRRRSCCCCSDGGN